MVGKQGRNSSDRRIEGMDVLNLLVSRSIETIEHNAFLQDAARIMRDKKIGSLLVVKAGLKVGIISETDIARRAVAEGASPETTTVESVMSSPIISIDRLATPETANDVMKEKGIRHLAVTEQGEIIGIISVRDLLRYFKVYYDGIGSLKKN
jgi:signal-transduction protein with cAMP-binding, CBS, and nucleotidyltransferase domain